MKIHDTRCPRHWSPRSLCECGAESDPSGDQPSDCAVGHADHMGRIFDSRPTYVPPGFSTFGPYDPYEDGRPATLRETAAVFACLFLALTIFATSIFAVAWSIWP